MGRGRREGLRSAGSFVKAVVYERYGPPSVLRVSAVPSPSIDADDEVLIRVQATSINKGDLHLMHGSPLLVRPMAGGFLKPSLRVLGSDVAGIVEGVGRAVTRFRIGDEVFGDLSESGFGGFAEYVTAKEAHLAIKPAGVDWSTAGAVPSAGLTALQALRVGGAAPAPEAYDPAGGTRVAVNGASGGVGTFAVQLAKHFGAHVTGVCSTRNVEMVRGLGADRVVDYTQDDFTTEDDARYDLILDAAAYRAAREHRRALGPTGVYVLVGGGFRRTIEVMLLGSILSENGGRTVRFMGIKQPNSEDLALLGQLLESGTLAPAIHRTVSLDEVPTAMDELEKHHASGKVVVIP